MWRSPEDVDVARFGFFFPRPEGSGVSDLLRLSSDAQSQTKIFPSLLSRTFLTPKSELLWDHLRTIKSVDSFESEGIKTSL